MLKRLIFIHILVSLLVGCNTVPYKEAVSEWKSHEDVGNWLDDNFYFDNDRQKTISKRLRSHGPSGLLVRNPEKLYASSYGYCADAAYFAIHNLNMIDKNYDAKWVFIDNARGRPNHWVAAFNYKGDLYIMDYGAGPKWNAMNGVHGPYQSLDEYQAFLSSLSIPGFEVGDVYYREMPGLED
ncbi:MAG: hypothetical protein OEY89_04780 [Gammaproteobacteria bacterium]|nr:hypothetical protein [Gammaproteobacteria bacterium]